METVRIAVKRPGGVYHYVLKSKIVTLRGGTQQTILFFDHDSPRYSLSDQQLTDLASMLVDQVGCSWDRAIRSVLGLAQRTMSVASNELPALKRRIERLASL